MATGNFDPNWFLAFVRIPCYCGKEYLAIFRTRFDLDNDPRLEPGDFNLVHVEGTTFAPLDGVYSGLHVRNILGCFLRRWNVMADHIIVCTPFISSDFTKGEWEWLFKHASSFSTHIITRWKSSKLIKNLPVFREGIENVFLRNLFLEDRYAQFQEHVINPIITDQYRVINYQRFHAKFYAGILSDRVEALLSSYNLFAVENPQLEQTCVHTYPRDIFIRRFLAPFKIDAIASVPDNRLECKNKVEAAFYSKDADECKHVTYTNRIWPLMRDEIDSLKP